QVWPSALPAGPPASASGATMSASPRGCAPPLPALLLAPTAPPHDAAAFPARLLSLSASCCYSTLPSRCVFRKCVRSKWSSAQITVGLPYDAGPEPPGGIAAVGCLACRRCNHSSRSDLVKVQLNGLGRRLVNSSYRRSRTSTSARLAKSFGVRTLR